MGDGYFKTRGLGEDFQTTRGMTEFKMNRVNIEEGTPDQNPKLGHRNGVDRRDSVQSGEKSNSKMDREVVQMIDNTANYSKSGGGNADAALVSENQKLKRKLEKTTRHACKKCGYARSDKVKRGSDSGSRGSASMLEGVQEER